MCDTLCERPDPKPVISNLPVLGEFQTWAVTVAPEVQQRHGWGVIGACRDLANVGIGGHSEVFLINMESEERDVGCRGGFWGALQSEPRHFSNHRVMAVKPGSLSWGVGQWVFQGVTGSFLKQPRSRTPPNRGIPQAPRFLPAPPSLVRVLGGVFLPPRASQSCDAA